MTSSDGVYPNGLFHSEGEGWKGMKKSRDQFVKDGERSDEKGMDEEGECSGFGNISQMRKGKQAIE